jgi:hypothetical protein
MPATSTDVPDGSGPVHGLEPNTWACGKRSQTKLVALSVTKETGIGRKKKSHLLSVEHDPGAGDAVQTTNEVVKLLARLVERHLAERKVETPL